MLYTFDEVNRLWNPAPAVLKRLAAVSLASTARIFYELLWNVFSIPILKLCLSAISCLTMLSASGSFGFAIDVECFVLDDMLVDLIVRTDSSDFRGIPSVFFPSLVLCYDLALSRRIC